VVEYVDALPRTQTGKLQRHELRRIAGEQSEKPATVAA
jgi:2-aminobenzoate-CoA ligase